MPRTRSRTPFYWDFTNYYANGSIRSERSGRHFSEIMTDEKTKPCNMSVEKQSPQDGWSLIRKDGGYQLGNGTSGFYIDPMATYKECVSPWTSRLKVSKLATSNSADLLTNLAELDDTVAMFGKNLAKSASYGGYSWGWAPLIGDIMATNDAANAVKNSVLDGGRRTHSYRTVDSFTKKSVKIPYLVWGSTIEIQHTWDVKVKYTGSITYENDVCAFYDYMGFHPSPKLFWDIVPLSFAVDYVLPIGDMLQRITPEKGWVKSANFTGWRIITAICREEHVLTKPGTGSDDPIVWNSGLLERKFVDRTFCNGIALEQKRMSKTIEALKMPTLKQAFDLTYLADSFHSVGKKLISPHVYRRRK